MVAGEKPESRLAVFGDYSGYTSKPWKDFIYESNQGKEVYFAATRQEGVDHFLADQ